MTFSRVSVTGREVSGGADEILNYIRMNRGVKTTEIAAALDIPQKTLERWIKRLRDEKKSFSRELPKQEAILW